MRRTLRKGAHIVVDVVVDNAKPRTRAILDLITAPVFFFGMLVLLAGGWDQFSLSWRMREAMPTVWAPPYYTMKFMVPLGAFLLMLQGVAECWKETGGYQGAGERSPKPMEGWMVPAVILVSFLILLGTGMPIAFALTGLSAILLWAFMGPTALFMVVASAFKQIGAEVFIAIPLFVVMAAVLQNSGISESLAGPCISGWGPSRAGFASELSGSAPSSRLERHRGYGHHHHGGGRTAGNGQARFHKRMVLGAITVGGA